MLPFPPYPILLITLSAMRLASCTSFRRRNFFGGNGFSPPPHPPLRLFLMVRPLLYLFVAFICAKIRLREIYVIISIVT